MIAGIGNELGLAICKELGFNEQDVHTIQITLSAKGSAKVLVIGYLDPGQELTTIIKKYNLVPKT